MKMNHLNLPVMDVGTSRDFLAKYFGMKLMFELKNNTLAMMKDDGEMILNLSHFDKQATEILYHRDFHVGFFIATREDVDAKYAEMIADGISVAAPQRLEGRYSFYLEAPGGFEVEVACLELGPRRATKPADSAPVAKD